VPTSLRADRFNTRFVDHPWDETSKGDDIDDVLVNAAKPRGAIRQEMPSRLDGQD
jgi:hypothetical protein